MINLEKTRFVNVKDIAEELRCSTTKVYLLRDAGLLKMHKNIAGKWVALREDFEAILENERYA